MIRYALIVLSLSVIATAAPTEFLFLGDTGLGNASQYEVAKAMTRYCKRRTCGFTLLLGDNFYPSGVQSTKDPQWKTAFEIPYGPLGIVFYPALGNHDYQGKIEAQIEYSGMSRLWKLPAKYYDFIKGDAHFFVVDTNSFDKAQAQWLKRGLEQSASRWKIVAGHHPIYSYGLHGNNDDLERDLKPIISGRASFYLAGHDHDKQVLKDPTDPQLHHIISGAGAETRPVTGGPLSLFHSETLGFSFFSINENSAQLEMVSEGDKTQYTHTFALSR